MVNPDKRKTGYQRECLGSRYPYSKRKCQSLIAGHSDCVDVFVSKVSLAQRLFEDYVEIFA